MGTPSWFRPTWTSFCKKTRFSQDQHPSHSHPSRTTLTPKKNTLLRKLCKYNHQSHNETTHTNMLRRLTLIFLVFIVATLCVGPNFAVVCAQGVGDPRYVDAPFYHDRQYSTQGQVDWNSTTQVSFYNAQRQLFHLLPKYVRIESMASGDGGPNTVRFDLAYYATRPVTKHTTPLAVFLNVSAIEEAMINSDELTAIVRYPSSLWQGGTPGRADPLPIRITTFPTGESSTNPTWLLALESMAVVVVCMALFLGCYLACAHRGGACSGALKGCCESAESALCCCAVLSVVSD